MGPSAALVEEGPSHSFRCINLRLNEINPDPRLLSWLPSRQLEGEARIREGDLLARRDGMPFVDRAACAEPLLQQRLWFGVLVDLPSKIEIGIPPTVIPFDAT